MTNEKSVLTLISSVAMKHKTLDQLFTLMICDKTLFLD